MWSVIYYESVVSFCFFILHRSNRLFVLLFYIKSTRKYQKVEFISRWECWNISGEMETTRESDKEFKWEENIQGIHPVFFGYSSIYWIRIASVEWVLVLSFNAHQEWQNDFKNIGIYIVLSMSFVFQLTQERQVTKEQQQKRSNCDQTSIQHEKNVQFSRNIYVVDALKRSHRFEIKWRFHVKYVLYK